ncbi:MAG: NAD(P)/FAD-dependent oxidoreductase [Candidatus Schekmanbacteria bacterium]|nr:NAD(P)/FAD-dependent oxidoreductase [Candidatus Schekmanbacteria bacterium]
MSRPDLQHPASSQPTPARREGLAAQKEAASRGAPGITVVGAGAAGLAAAILAAATLRGRAAVFLVDSARRPGAKILISGGGRCNVTHDHVRASDFNGDPAFVRRVLRAWDENRTVAWFRELGVDLKREETGKLFPTSDCAQTVLDALRGRAGALGVTELLGARVETVLAGERGFEIETTRGALRARHLIMATGGRSLPKSGSDGSGWRILQALGHSVTSTHTALVPLVLAPAFFHRELQGLAADVEVSVWVEGKLVDRRQGSLLFTHFGVSGPAAMDASRHWTAAHDLGRKAEVRCNFAPGAGGEEVQGWFLAAARETPRRHPSVALAAYLPGRLAEQVTRYARIAPELRLAELTRRQRADLAAAITRLCLPVVGHRGWNHAEVTAGGVPLSEVDAGSMASRRVPGLFLAGELLDCDGRIGGFNFQWAWATGAIAGTAAATSLITDPPSGPVTK